MFCLIRRKLKRVDLDKREVKGELGELDTDTYVQYGICEYMYSCIHVHRQRRCDHVYIVARRRNPQSIIVSLDLDGKEDEGELGEVEEGENLIRI